MSTGLSPKFPLTISEYGDFANNETIKDLVKQNFKTLLLTIPGERIMIPDFGVGLATFLFEQDTPLLRSELSSEITRQVQKYLPYIELVNIDLDKQNKTDDILTVSIRYFIKPLSVEDLIELTTI